MVERLSFQDEISKNKFKSILLIFIIFIVLIFLGYVISFAFEPGYFFIILIFSIIFSISYIVLSYYNSAKIALFSVSAKEASNVEYRMLYNLVEGISLSSGLPMPKVYIMDSEQINAFASGRNPENAVICVTKGAVSKLNKQELEGVIAHEMAHIANYDIRFMTLTAVLIGLISILAEIFLRSLWFSGNNKKNGWILIVAILVAILAPILTNLISFAISRKREFVADATGVKFTRYSAGLKNALQKIKSEQVSVNDRKKFPKAVAPLFLSDPFKSKFVGLFSTHPPIDERISKLERM
jgi:heat shock protein HtpX